MKDMNNKEILDLLITDTTDPRTTVLNFLFNSPIEKIHNNELRTVAITTRQSFEILFSMLQQIVEADKNPPIQELDPLNNQSA